MLTLRNCCLLSRRFLARVRLRIDCGLPSDLEDWLPLGAKLQLHILGCLDSARLVESVLISRRKVHLRGVLFVLSGIDSMTTFHCCSAFEAVQLDHFACPWRATAQRLSWG